MGYAFISYSTQNQVISDSMRQLLTKYGISSWMAPADIPAGSKYAQVINRAIKECSCVILMLSNASQKSIWVAKEIERAINYHKTIIPVQIEDLVLNDEFEFYISTDQIVAIKQIEDTSPEIKKILARVRTICGNSDGVNLSKYAEEDHPFEKLPNLYSFYEMLGISQINDYSIEDQWISSKIEESLVAPVGITEDGKQFYLDIHNKADGSIGLIAGSAGSGKSEFLESYVLSLSLHYHPHEVSFIIIDGKGGLMAYQFIELPHLVGAITDIREQDLHRLLQSLENELLHRHQVFIDYNCTHADTIKDIDDYLERYRTGHVLTPLPHLIIIVDEFADLKVLHPELINSLIKTAQIGRSLGIHLILSTQIPADMVDNRIERSIGFRICFKTACNADSQTVLGSNLASYINVPGRAYFCKSYDKDPKLFQCSYSSQKIPALRGTTIEQRDAILHNIKKYCKDNNIEKAQEIYYPSF